MRYKKYVLVGGLLAAGLLLVGCGGLHSLAVVAPTPVTTSSASSQTDSQNGKSNTQTGQAGSSGSVHSEPNGGGATAIPALATTKTDADGQLVTANPDAVTVLVNKQVGLPKGYQASDLVVPNVPWLYPVTDERHEMRKEAAAALEKLFAGAKKDGIYLAGVSAYRSYETQVSLYNSYVQTQGKALADKYSAQPGHSEHQTGMAIDVSGMSGKCAADDCFADTPEAKWLAQHAQEYGYIVRYQKSKESITGYNYEPWHIRYVGVALAKELTGKGLTLEEYYNNVKAVSGS